MGKKVAPKMLMKLTPVLPKCTSKWKMHVLVEMCISALVFLVKSSISPISNQNVNYFLPKFSFTKFYLPNFSLVPNLLQFYELNFPNTIVRFSSSFISFLDIYEHIQHRESKLSGNVTIVSY